MSNVLCYVFCVAFVLWLVAGAGVARAETPVAVGVPSAQEKTEAKSGTEYEPSASAATEVYLFCDEYTASGFREDVYVAGVLIAKMLYPIHGTEDFEGGTFSFLVGAKQKWKREETTGSASCWYSYQSLKGGEGPEGKEGKEGKPGAEGKEGPAGKEGASSSAGGKDEVVSFGLEAQATFSEIVERIEVLVWCIIGTLVSGVLFVMVRRVLDARS